VGEANALAHAFVANLLGRGLASATIARRLATLRKMVRAARTFGRITWSLDVPSPKVVAYRDCTGPSATEVKRLFRTLTQRAERTPKGRRDLAAASLLYFLGLRRSELVTLDVADLRLESCQVMILGKGRTAKEPMTVDELTSAVLNAWLDDRGRSPGPLFVALDPGSEGERLTVDGVAWLISDWGRAAGIKRRLTPHMIRHAAATGVALETRDAFTVKAFGRWAKLETAQRYVDASKDLQGAATRALRQSLGS
jgi:integrase/recombinase XerC